MRKTCITSVLPEVKYIEMLDKKLNEELAEYQESKTFEKLVDLLEVIRAVAVARGSSIEEIESISIIHNMLNKPLSSDIRRIFPNIKNYTLDFMGIMGYNSA